MAVSVVQSRGAPTILQPFDNFTAVGAFASPCTAGNTIVVVIGGGTIISGEIWDVANVNDTDGNTYTVIPAALLRWGGAPPNDAGVYDEGTAIAFATGIAHTGATNTITVPFGGTIGNNQEYASGWIYELSPCTFDHALAAKASSGTTTVVGPLTPSASGAFVVGVMQLDYSGSTGGVGLPQAGWTQDMNTGMGGFAQAASHIVQTTAASLSYEELINGGTWVSSMAIFVPPGAAPTLAPSASSVSAATATITTPKSVVGSALGVSAATALITAQAPLTASAPSVSAATATVTTPSSVAIAASASSISAASVILQAVSQLHPSALSVSSATAKITAPTRFTASAQSTSRTSATVGTGGLVSLLSTPPRTLTLITPIRTLSIIRYDTTLQVLIG